MAVKIHASIVWAILMECFPHGADNVALAAALEGIQFERSEALPVVKACHTIYFFCNFPLGCLNALDILLGMGGPKGAAIFKVWPYKCREKENDDIWLSGLECSEDPRAHPASHINFIVDMGVPAEVVVGNYSQVSDIVGCFNWSCRVIEPRPDYLV